jgi:hypothetical protein
MLALARVNSDVGSLPDRKMNCFFHLFVVVLLVAAPTLAQQKTNPKIPVQQHPYYRRNVIPALKELVASRAKSRTNHFYVGRVEEFDGGHSSVLVFWKENNALVLWESQRGFGRDGKPDARYDLSQSRRYWRLDKDVVPTLEDVGWSSFLITKQDARTWVRDCVRYGTLYVIHRTARSNKSLDARLDSVFLK